MPNGLGRAEKKSFRLSFDLPTSPRPNENGENSLFLRTSHGAITPRNCNRKVLNFGHVEVPVSANLSSRITRFSTFEVNLHTGELRQRGQKVKLQEQPLQVLAALLERPGELVTREELRGKLWPADTFVDFDHSLNAAIKRLRDALGESADTPIFIETLARRGYRFIGNVEIRTATPPALSDLEGLKPDTERGRVPTKVSTTSASGPWARRWQVGGAVAIVALASMATGWFLWRQASR